MFQQPQFDPKKILNNKNLITVSDTKSHETTFTQILENAKKNNKPVVITATSGPFAKSDVLPAGWTDKPKLVGCTAQLEKLNAMSDVEVYALNIHPSDYQIQLLSDKGFTHMKMISIDEEMQDILGLDTINHIDKAYLSRFSLVVRPDGSWQKFEVPTIEGGKVNAETAVQHVSEIQNYINPRPTAGPK